MAKPAPPSNPPHPDDDAQRWRHDLRTPLVIILFGSVIWAASAMNSLAFPDFSDVNLADTAAEQALLIEDHLTQWRLVWFLAMIARVLMGAGLWMLGRMLRTREHGMRAHAATAIMWLGGLSAPLGVARFAITFGSPEFNADPGNWFVALWVAHWFGIMIAALGLCWLTWRSLAPRWVGILLILTAVAGLAITAPAPVYTPGLLVFSAVALMRLRSAGDLAPQDSSKASDFGSTDTTARLHPADRPGSAGGHE